MAGRRPLGIGVIGAWGRGKLALLAHRPQEGFRLVAAADTDPRALERLRAAVDAPLALTRDYRELLARDDMDAVFVTTPDYCHAEHAVAALAAGKAVYLEKPLAITIDDCDRILQAARQHRAKLYLGHNMRHFSFVRKMKQLIDAGAIGEVRAAWCRHFVGYGGDAYFKDWHAERRLSTGLLLQKGCHDIDVLHWLCGATTRRVTAMGNLSVYNRIPDRHAPGEQVDVGWYRDHWPPLALKGLNPVIDVEDLSMVLMEMTGGILASYQQCHYAPDSWRNYTVIGTEGRIENLGDGPGHVVVAVWNQRTRYNPCGDEQHFLPPRTGGHGGSDPRIVDEFLRYASEDAKITTSAAAARQAVAVGCKATESLRSGSVPLDVPPLEPDLAAYFDADLADSTTP